MFQPSGKGSIRILTTRVQANLQSIFITTMQVHFNLQQGHCSTNNTNADADLRSSALGHRGTQEWSL